MIANACVSTCRACAGILAASRHASRTDMQILFYETDKPYGCFSNFSRHAITLDGIVWPTSEHYLWFKNNCYRFST